MLDDGAFADALAKRELTQTLRQPDVEGMRNGRDPDRRFGRGRRGAFWTSGRRGGFLFCSHNKYLLRVNNNLALLRGSQPSRGLLLDIATAVILAGPRSAGHGAGPSKNGEIFIRILGSGFMKG